MINNIHIKPKINIDLEYSYSVLQNRAGVAMAGCSVAAEWSECSPSLSVAAFGDPAGHSRTNNKNIARGYKYI